MPHTDRAGGIIQTDDGRHAGTIILQRTRAGEPNDEIMDLSIRRPDAARRKPRIRRCAGCRGGLHGTGGSDDFDDLLGIRDEGGGAVEFRFRVEGLRFVGTDGPDQLYLGTATWSLSVAGGLSRTGAAGMGMAAHADEFREYARLGFNLGETGLNGLTFSVSSSVPGLIGGPLRYPTISYDRATAPPTTLGYAQFNAFSPCRYQGEPNCPGEFDFRSEYMIFAASSLTTRVIGTIPDPDPAAVPEPGTWAMMMLGFGLTGAAARRRWTGATA